jgi:RHS repeat-associated protein
VNVDTLSPNYNQVLQDLYYYYDPVGNITTIENNLDEPVYYNNSVMEPHQKFTYDALYRLTIAEGRELVQAAGYTSEDTWADAMAPSAPGSNACRNYTQTYTYDKVGNITELQHSAGTGSYTRTYTYPGSSNRLSSTQIGGNPAYSYTHDARGNMIDMPHLSAMDWNNQNQLSHITRGTTEAYYQYSNGQRIRKYVDKGSEKEERIYLGNYEVYRKYDSSNTLIVERETVHVSDDTGRIAMLEVRTQGNASDDNYTAANLTRYIYSNHLQSASLELDGSADIISYEEYHPYGTTAYQAADASINAVAKRYRYTGKERDEESGLYYHGARYYIPWLCRWSASDPLESKYAGWSSYNYGFDNPVKWTDSTGMGPEGYANTIDVRGPVGFRDAEGYTHEEMDGGTLSEVVVKPDNSLSLFNSPVANELLGKTSPVDNTRNATEPSLEGLKSVANYQAWLNQPILMPDIYGNGHAGARKDVMSTVNSISQEYNNAVADNIINGPFGSAGYLIGGPKGSFVGAALDQVSFSLYFSPKKGSIGSEKTETNFGAKLEPSVKSTPKISENVSSLPNNGRVSLTVEQAAKVNPEYATRSNFKTPLELGLRDGMELPSTKILEVAQQFLGEGYTEPIHGSGRFVSSDGTRVFRMGLSDITGAHGGGPHVNIETLAPNPNKPGKLKVIQNLHIYIKD